MKRKVITAIMAWLFIKDLYPGIEEKRFPIPVSESKISDLSSTLQSMQFQLQP